MAKEKELTVEEAYAKTQGLYAARLKARAEQNMAKPETEGKSEDVTEVLKLKDQEIEALKAENDSLKVEIEALNTKLAESQTDEEQ